MNPDLTESAAIALLTRQAARFTSSDRFGYRRDLHDLLAGAQRRVKRPMRLAVVGRIKCGKSTLVNALIGRSLASTGTTEMTFTVAEYRYDTHEFVRVHYRDATGRAPAEFGLDELHRLNDRDAGRLDELRLIDRLEVHLPAELLTEVGLLDTPGLGSVYGDDSANTERLLATMDLTLDDVGKVSDEAMAQADAVLYLFTDDLGGPDLEVVTGFVGGSVGSAPFNSLRAFGVLSRCDGSWGPRTAAADYDPFAPARARIRAFQDDDDRIAELFHTVVPIASLLAEGAFQLNTEHLSDLHTLSLCELPDLVRWLRGQHSFLAEETDCPLPLPARCALAAVLGCWGVFRASVHLKDGRSDEELRAALVRDSGVADVVALVRSHFGRRSTLIKLNALLADIERTVARHRTEDGGRTDTDLMAVTRAVAEVRERVLGFTDLELLRGLQQPAVNLRPGETERARRLAGEFGISCAQRLGQPAGTPPADLTVVADDEAAYWRRRVNEDTNGNPTRPLLQTLSRIADQISYRVHSAADLLSGY
ncbi:dynamin family protein [Micromonospora sp. C72]|uniref:dynamin family protein n=1 Tax=Micromonospora sp. C72 TaxID=2824880 RepID=UPI001B362068|nr:dynamin family protein [Micromonospora sp. C72]MBQ1041514.1 dynamin family protein [Micromonospora sp. C72]